MTVSSIIPVNNYSGNGSSTIFDFDFLIENAQELLVTHISEQEVFTELKYGIDYSINEIGNVNGSYIVFPISGSSFSVLAPSEKISLSLSLEIKQESEFKNSSYLNLSILEWTFDYIVRVLQMMNRRFERCIKVSEGGENTPDALLSSIETSASISLKSSQISCDSAELSRKWAVSDSEVEDGLYSSKYYSEAAKEIIEDISSVVDKAKIDLNTLKMFDIVLKDHILSYEESQGFAQLGTYVNKTALAGEYYGYSSFYDTCIKEKETAIATEITLGENTLTVYINENGHSYYDIADKEIVDTFYNTYGVAWYYGIDTKNERIFLPRNDHYFKNGTSENIGKFIKAGLPNITGSFGGLSTTTNGAFSLGSVTFRRYAGEVETGGAVSFNASRSDSIYGNSNTVQPPSVSAVAYMVVGNTLSEEGLTSLVSQSTEILTQVNSAVNNVVPNNSSLIAGYTMPSSKYIDLTLGANGSVYTAPANGWFQFSKVAGVAYAVTHLANQSNNLEIVQCAGNNPVNVCASYIPVKKDDSVYVGYTATGITNCFKFIYAEGEV